jgi:ferric-dicitrate binding protein FerR (iron transport regulator)
MKEEYKNYWETLVRITRLFDRYDAGTLDEKSRESLEKWNPEDLPERIEVTDELLDRGCLRATNGIFPKLEPRESEKAKRGKRILFTPLYKYAAAVAVLLIMTFSVMYLSDFGAGSRKELIADNEGNNNLMILSAEDGIRHVTLPDGTSLSINKGSKISYNEYAFNKKKREVWIEGEAYFDVAGNPEKLFIIHNENLQTVVRGTAFNVKAYKELSDMSIAVRTGKVEVQENGRLIATLTPNRQLVYTKSDGSVQEFSINREDAGAWMDNRLVLQNAGIDELLFRIKQLYDIEIILDNDVLRNERVVISFEKDAGFTRVMDMICLLYNVKYKRTSPERVTIYR